MKLHLDQIAHTFETLTPELVQQMGEIYAADARFIDPFNDVQGLAEIQRIFHHMYLALEAPRFVINSRLIDANQCFLAWEFKFRFRNFRRHTTQTVRGASHLTLGPDGLISSHHDYWDTSRELYEKLPIIGAAMRWLRQRAST